MSSDESTKAALHANCMEKAETFEAEVKSRNEELKALAEAKKVLKETTSGAGEQSYLRAGAFLQLGSGIASGVDLAHFEAGPPDRWASLVPGSCFPLPGCRFPASSARVEAYPSLDAPHRACLTSLGGPLWLGYWPLLILAKVFFTLARRLATSLLCQLH
ncbi:unnamed protein product [Prorocentrum cordatum]|uniref:Uncharacterized protein n=1 Tax=Prorocentrum cordatum TaxID=2364126 RepID=A0ABN9T1Y6_9DINO|nr:unnamed protein product [Polarella glacialis]